MLIRGKPGRIASNIYKLERAQVGMWKLGVKPALREGERLNEFIAFIAPIHSTTDLGFLVH